jgi:serine/threonine protein kinase
MSKPQPEPTLPGTSQEKERLPEKPAESLPSHVPGVQDSDNAPTIISKTLVSPAGSMTSLGNLLRGRKLAHFELLEPIGVGGMAAVLRARDTQLDRLVALKILPPDLAADVENVRRFENEARAAAKLDHENIARVYYYGCDQGLHFIAFEFVEGRNLRVLLEQQGRIPILEAVHYVLQIATGLVHAAERGVIHRDIKPSNIIVADNGRAKLVDMGLARNTGIRPSDALTQSGVTLGTFDYISPEQAMEPREADCRSDLYSLGCTFYHTVTGLSPVPDGTAARKLQFHQNEAPIDPRQLNGDIPDELAAILSKMMAKNPDERYQRPELLVQHLLALSRKLQGASTPWTGTDVVFVDSILPSPPRSRPFWLLVGGAAALVLLIVVLGPLLNPEPANPPPSAWAGGRLPATPPSADSKQKQPLIASPLKPGGAPVPSVEPESAAQPTEASTVEDLRAAVRGRHKGTIRLPASLYELSPQGLQGSSGALMAFGNCDLTLEGKNGARPVFRCSPGANAGPRDQTQAALLQVDSGIVTLRGIQFEIEADEQAAVRAILAIAGGQLVLEDCEFRELGARPGISPLVTVVRILRRLTFPDRAPSVFFKRCAFYGGSSAVCFDEGAHLHLEDCLLGVYQQPILVKAADRSPHRLKTSISFHACSWLTGPTPSIFVSSQQPCQLTLNQSIISQMERSDGNPFLLLGPGQTTNLKWVSGQNYFHNLDCLVAARTDEGGQERLVSVLGDFQRFGNSFVDRGSQLGSTSPWESSDPLQRLSAGDALAASRVNAGLAAVRLGRDEALGARKLCGRQLYARGLPPLEPVGAAGSPVNRELIVDGQGNKPGTYKTLASALGDADAEAEIDISVRVNGPLPVRSLEIGNRKVTIRAAEGFHPEVTFNPEQVPTSDGEAILFRLHDGEVAFEQLALRVSPLREREAAKLQALVAVTGTGRCRFRNCTVTLTEDSAARVCLIALADPTGAMMGAAGKPPRPGMPAIEMENCFVRGAGEMVAVRLSRPFQMDIKNALIALNGSLLTVEGNRPEASFSGDGALITVDRVTAYLAQSLVHLRATPALPMQVPVRVTSATSSVFVAALGAPLLRVDGAQSEDDLKRRLSWQGRRNFYSPTASLLLWQPLHKEEMPHKYGSERWSELWGRGDDLAGFAQSIRFAGAPLLERGWAEAAPGDFRILSTDPPDADWGNRGADLDQMPSPVQNSPANE